MVGKMHGHVVLLDRRVELLDNIQYGLCMGVFTGSSHNYSFLSFVLILIFNRPNGA